jgi:hypothetical protein
MIGNIYTYNDPFDGGPTYRVQRAVGLIRPGDLRISHRVFLVILVGWVVPAILSAIEGRAIGVERSGAFLFDFANYARFLIAAPLFIIGESIAIPRLSNIAHHFLDSGLVTEADRNHFNDAIKSTRKLINSWIVELAVILLAFAIVASLFRFINLGSVPAWYKPEGTGYLALSAAGWWNTFVCAPILIILFLSWVWRVFLWGRFLWLMSRLDLRLIPGHPDLAGGLKFVSDSISAFLPIGFALGAIVAGMVANRLLFHGASPAAYKVTFAVLVIVVVALFTSPLFIFTRNLTQERRRGLLAYGALAVGLGQQFERKWFHHSERLSESALGVPDFSSTTDLYQIVSNAYSMWTIPIDYRDVIVLIVATVLPFLPVVLIAIPFDIIWQNLTKLLF